eukprot:Gb_00358 [translate_table: standard]
MLHTGNYSIAIEVFSNRCTQSLEIGFCKLYSATIVFAYRLQNMNNVNFDAIDSDGGQIRMHCFIKFICSFRRHKTHSMVHNFIHSQILHGRLQTRGKQWIQHLGRQSSGSRTKPTPIPTERMPYIHMFQIFELGLQIPNKCFHASVFPGFDLCTTFSP